MCNKPSATTIGVLIWLLTSIVLAFGFFIYELVDNQLNLLISFAVLFASAIISSPALFILWLILPRINKKNISTHKKIERLFIAISIIILPFSIVIAFAISAYSDLNFLGQFLPVFALSFSILLTSVSISIFLIKQKINHYFSSFKNNHFMQQHQFENANENISNTQPAYSNFEKLNKQNTSNKTLIKGVITAALILLMLIPTVFVNNLVTERQKRQQDVVKEVKQGWATEQTIYGPYLYIPYLNKEVDKNNKEIITTKHLYLLPENLNVNGNIAPEVRPRSIYKVLLYKSDIKTEGNFAIKIPSEINVNTLQLNNAKICFGVTDLKGIEEKLSINFNNQQYDLLPGLPIKEFETITQNNNNTEDYTKAENTTAQVELMGLSSSINLTVEDLQKPLPFNLNLKIKGSEQLHFVPLSANSNYTMVSTWANPKFDGSNLPSSRDVNDSGFTAKWNFNKANLPYSTTLQNFDFGRHNYAFGVSMLQPTDQYSKTLRSVKYAILFIGLTFALFFIIELMQKKPMHPVQYVLIGIALVIFFTLLLSISEFLMFDAAYCIASIATILLITLYAKAHFKSNKTASVFGLFLSCLYAFIFVLIRLEDAALLVGSIGLFVILAIVMFGSRKINWYGNDEIETVNH